MPARIPGKQTLPDTWSFSREQIRDGCSVNMNQKLCWPPASPFRDMTTPWYQPTPVQPQIIRLPISYGSKSTSSFFLQILARLFNRGFPGGSDSKESACSAGLIPGSGRSPGEGNGNPLQSCCLENPIDREAWWATVHRVAKSKIRLKRLSTPTPELC